MLTKYELDELKKMFADYLVEEAMNAVDTEGMGRSALYISYFIIYLEDQISGGKKNETI